MLITKNNIDELNATINITLVKDDYQDRVNKTLKDYSKRVSMPGFRQGKVPMGLIKRQYEKPIMADEINKLVSESLFKYLNDEKIDYIGEPLPSENQPKVDLDKDEHNFIFDIALTPQFDIAIDSNLKLPKYKIQVSEQTVDNYVQQYKNSAGKNVPVEESNDKSFLKGLVYQTDENGNKLENGLSNSTSMLVSRVNDEETKKQFIGRKIGDEIRFDLTKAFPEADAKAMLNNGAIDFKTINANFAFKIDEILEFVPGELDQELYDKFFGKDQIHNEDELRTHIKGEVEKGYEMESDFKLLDDARKTLIDSTSFNVPTEFMIRVILARPENKNLDKEGLLKQYPHFENDLKWNLIQGKIVTANELKVTEDEALEEAKKITAQEFMRYGIPMNQIPVDVLDNYAKERLAKDRDRNMIQNSVVNNKITALIKERATLENKEISYEDFGKLFEA